MSLASTAAAALAVVVAASLGTPTANASEDRPSRLVLEDSRGDVWLMPADDEPVQVDMPTADVVGAVAVHGRYRVRVTARFTDLQRVDPQHYFVVVGTPSPRSWSFDISTGPAGWGGRLQIVSFDESGGETVGGCAAASHELDYDTDTVRLMVPRSCLRRPEWVRVMMGNDLSQGRGPESTRYWDNPHNSSTEQGSFTRRLFRASPPDGTEAPAPFQVRLTDPTGDVWTDGPGATLAPDTPAADVVRAAIAHRPHRVLVRMRFADLPDGGRQGYEAWIFTQKGAFLVWLDVGPAHPEGVLRMVAYSGGRLTCRGARGVVDRAADRVSMVIPRRCLGRPEWVQLMLANYLLRGGSHVSSFTDNPHNARASARRPTPRIYVDTSTQR